MPQVAQEKILSEEQRAQVARRTAFIFAQHQQSIFKRTDHLFAFLMALQWLACLAAAHWISPQTWAGPVSRTHLHVWAALFLGGAITTLPVFLALTHPGRPLTRHVIAVAQMLMSALLIHLTGGRIETHFHIFGSLAFLAFYRDWRVLLSATVVTAADHFLGGIYWPQSVYGVLSASPWLWVEHAGWVAFEDVFLTISCLQSVREMQGIAERQAKLEATHEIVMQSAAVREEAERNYRSIFENAIDGIFQTTPEGQYLKANPALARIYGYDTPDALVQGLQDITRQLYVDPERRQEFVRIMQEQNAVSGFEAEIYRKDGSIIWIAEHARAVRDAEGRLLYYEGTVRDITERKNLEAERERLLAEALERADHDPLTGLLNHRAFHKRFGEEAARAERDGTSLAIAMLDMDNFKFFNDAYGHAAGDDVLRRVAESLRSCCRHYDILARFGGDEFALLMPGTTSDMAAGLAARLKTALAEVGYSPANSQVAIPLTLSVGIAVYPEDGQERQEVLETADARLLRTKTGGSDDEDLESLRSLLMDSFHGFSMLDALVTAVDNKDRYTRKHSEDVMRYALQIAREMELSEAEQRTIQVAALLHDVGKIGVPDRILRKPGHLTSEEFEAIQQHPMMGAVIVGAVAGFENTLDCIRHHHERWDGRGYPYGLSHDETPLLARIMAVADAFSAMTMDRPYRKGKRWEEALDILASGAGDQWDPTCVAAFLRATADPCQAGPRFEALAA
ncbi:MAG: diguanylate cyclase [Armatimonadota bacterium]|nr:diguanylate cyclase [Armatimonadota bacterium]